MTEAMEREWRLVAGALVVMAVIVLLDGVGWKIRDLTIDKPTRLELAVRCLTFEKNIHPVVPAGSPLADSAKQGSFRAVVEGNDVTVALAANEDEATKLVGYYRQLGGSLSGRLEQRAKVVYLWLQRSSPTQRQTMYDCQY
jgi:hypothetical protein